MIDKFADVLELDPEQKATEAEEKLRIVALKRKFPNKILKPLKARQAPMQCFPYDIWHVVA